MNTQQHPVGTPASKPRGWPRWLWLLVRVVVAEEHRIELENPDQRAKTARELANKLVEARRELSAWRERAISAEQCVSEELRTTIKEACKRHDQKYGAGMAWRF